MTLLHQAAQKAVESLLTTSRYVDEEGEATQDLADLASCIANSPFKLKDALGVNASSDAQPKGGA